MEQMREHPKPCFIPEVRHTPGNSCELEMLHQQHQKIATPLGLMW